MSDSSAFTLTPGSRFSLADFDPNSTGPYSRKRESRGPIEDNLERLRDLHERLYAQGAKALLIVLQGMDTGGKDGTIKHVLGAFNPQGVGVTSFKVPTEEEARHDFLWRVHAAAPMLGMVSIFNRSHYEDVLVVRVKQLQPKSVWSTRYEHINTFERLLSESGVTIVKFFLHISPEEQADRLRDRQQDPEKHWKFNPGDLEDRALWTDYQRAYEDALSKCNTPWAPWYVIPANPKVVPKSGGLRNSRLNDGSHGLALPRSATRHRVVHDPRRVSLGSRIMPYRAVIVAPSSRTTQNVSGVVESARHHAASADCGPTPPVCQS